MRLWNFAVVIIAVTSRPVAAEDWSREVGGWDVGRSGDACIMLEDYEGEGSTEVALMTLDDPTGTSLMITNGNWSSEKDQHYELKYHLGEWVYTLTSIGIGTSYSRKGFGTVVGTEFLADFAKASGLEITRGETLVDSLSLAGSGAALAVFERCRREVAADLDRERKDRERLAHIPVDPFADGGQDEAPAIPVGPHGPVPVHATMARVLDNYPARAIRDEIEGKVGVQVAVGPDGRATSCTVASSSGSDILDEAACADIRRYARFEPAIDEAGQPIEGSFATTISYSLGR